jgi:hypothetical protein
MGAITEQEKLLLQEKTHEHFNIAVLADITEFDLTHDNSSILDVRSEMQKSGIHWTNLHEAQHMIECKKLQFDAEL